jgi:hypothetical protein
VDFILKFGGEHARNIGAGKDGRLDCEAAGFDGLVLKAEAGGDKIGAEDLVAAGTPAAIDRIGAQDREARAVAVMEDLDHVGPGQGCRYAW